MDNEILNYKDLAALPKIKAIYEVQRPDLISYEPYHRYTSDETLERYSYGEVLRAHRALLGCAGWAPAWGELGGAVPDPGIVQGWQEWGRSSPRGLGRGCDGGKVVLLWRQKDPSELRTCAGTESSG